jgi:hypothetical protein
MNAFRAIAATLALVGTVAVVPAVAQAAEPPRNNQPATMDRGRGGRGGGERGDRDHRGDHDGARWGYDRDGRWGQYDRGHRRDFDRDWRGYRANWMNAGMRDDQICRFEWENGAPPDRLFQIGCFVR